MYYIKIDNKLDRTIEKEIAKKYSLNKIIDFLKSNNINQSNNVEIIIFKDSLCSFWYARYILKGRFEQGEPAIAKNGYYSCWYAIEVLNERFELGEQKIKNMLCKQDYELRFGIKL